MERIVYDRMAEHDATHWWYRARRRVLAWLTGRSPSQDVPAEPLPAGIERAFGRVGRAS